MNSKDTGYFEQFKQAILAHNLKSGEILLALRYHRGSSHRAEELARQLLATEGIKTEREALTLEALSRKEALHSMSFGLSTKANYTKIDRQFTQEDCERYAGGFANFFTNPLFYKPGGKIYRAELDLLDFWQSGGCIAVDNNKIGLFWVNDLYDKWE